MLTLSGLLITILSFVTFSIVSASLRSYSTMAALRRAPPLLFDAAAGKKHTATVIFVHGLGDTGYGWSAVVENWRLRHRLDEVKFILPHAPRIPVTAAFGESMPGWYDISALSGKIDDIRKEQDERGILQSREYFNGLIEAEIKDHKIPASRIVLGGFSQGGAISLFTGLTAKHKLAGIVALSSYLPLDSKFGDFVQENDNNRRTPILMCHGDQDQVVPYGLGKMSYEMIKSQGFDVTMKTYPGMPHAADPEELDEIEQFLSARLPPQGDKKSEL
ncbi:Phospholipase/carboxylesterase [Hypoxylon fuscum]|nr:Phospholipase/carboxylesterase [Hypoxylon fuscum]